MRPAATYLLAVILLVIPLHAAAQVPDAPSVSAASTSRRTIPSAPVPADDPSKVSLYPYLGLFCGVGATTSSVSTKPTTGCGAAVTFLPLPVLLATEVGIMGPQANRSNFSAYLSEDLVLPLAPRPLPYFPSAIVGYSRLFETGHALDFGLALNTARLHGGKHLEEVRFELRDYYTFANPSQHNLVLRFGIINAVRD